MVLSTPAAPEGGRLPGQLRYRSCSTMVRYLAIDVKHFDREIPSLCKSRAVADVEHRSP